MFRTPVRVACVVVALLLSGGLGYRAYQHETSLTAERSAAAAADRSVSKTAELLLDLRASFHAYVAPGQGLPFWGKRAQEGIQALREQLATLDDQTDGALKASLDAVTQLEAAERRARTYVSRDEMLLAGDVVFTEIRDVLATITSDVQSIRTGLQATHERRGAGIRRGQLMLAAGILGAWIVVALVLVPPQTSAARQDPSAWRSELKETLKKPASAGTPKVLDPVPVATPTQPAIAVDTLRTVSEICADLSALSDPGALQGTLERVTGLLKATGLIVWVASNDGGHLAPVAAHGFDPKIVNRIGRVPRDSANLTAAAFRDNSPRISAATEAAPGALAVPLCGPTGPAGVLSVELKAGETAHEPTVALAAIVAAQLATLTMPIPELEVAIPEPERKVI